MKMGGRGEECRGDFSNFYDKFFHSWIFGGENRYLHPARTNDYEIELKSFLCHLFRQHPCVVVRGSLFYAPYTSGPPPNILGLLFF